MPTMVPQIGCSLTTFLVSDIEKSKAWYKDVLGCEVTDWWAIRDGLTGLALKLLQAASPEDVRPNPAPLGSSQGWDVYAYVENWAELDSLYDEFTRKSAEIAIEPVVYPDGGPWKEFAIRHPDGYGIAFGGVDGVPRSAPNEGEDQASDHIRIVNRRDRNQQFHVENTHFSGSEFVNCRAEDVTIQNVSMPRLSFMFADLNHVRFENINFRNGLITDADLSDLEIDGAQLGGAYIHHIGLPPKGHPNHVEGAKQSPLRFEDCDLHGSSIMNCDLSGVQMTDCKTDGMTINGIEIDELLRVYKAHMGGSTG